MLLEVVVVWLVVSPVVGVALGLAIARAAHLAERREALPAPAAAATDAVAAQPAAQLAAQPALRSSAPPAGPDAVQEQPGEVVPHPSMKLVTDVPGPRPAPSHDDVLRLRLTGPEH